MNRHRHFFYFYYYAWSSRPIHKTGKQYAVLPAKTQEWQLLSPEGLIEDKDNPNDQNSKQVTVVKYLLHKEGLTIQLRATGVSYYAWIRVQGIS